MAPRSFRAIIRRHAEHHKETGHLHPHAHEAARGIGKAIAKGKRVIIVHSPALRAKQTATAINDEIPPHQRARLRQRKSLEEFAIHDDNIARELSKLKKVADHAIRTGSKSAQLELITHQPNAVFVINYLLEKAGVTVDRHHSFIPKNLEHATLIFFNSPKDHKRRVVVSFTNYAKKRKVVEVTKAFY